MTEIAALTDDDAPEIELSAGPLLHASVYDDLRLRMITGKITPGVGLSTRGLALELGVSQMPVRDALSRLAAEGAVRIRSKRKIEVPLMTEARFTDLLECRLLLEPRGRRPGPAAHRRGAPAPSARDRQRAGRRHGERRRHRLYGK